MHGPLSRNLRSRSNVFEFTPVDYCLDGLSRTIASDDDSFFHDAAHTLENVFFPFLALIPFLLLITSR